MSKLFERKTHQAFERRAKNDQVIDIIAHRFQPDDTVALKREANADQYMKTKLQNEAEEYEQRIRSRKEKEREMKEVLDLQVQRKKNEKTLLKDEVLQHASRIN